MGLNSPAVLLYMQRPVYKNVESNELPMLYRSVYRSWTGRLFSILLLLTVLLSPLDTTHASEESEGDVVDATSASEDTKTDIQEATTDEDSRSTDESKTSDTASATHNEATPSSTNNVDDTVTTSTVTTEQESADSSAEVTSEQSVSDASTVASTSDSSQLGTAATGTVSTGSTVHTKTLATSTAATATPMTSSAEPTSASTTTTAGSTTAQSAIVLGTSTASSNHTNDSVDTPPEATSTTETTTIDDTHTSLSSVSQQESELGTSSDVTPADDVDEQQTETPVETQPLDPAAPATSTNTNIEPTETTVTNSSNRYQFAESNCVAVADGSYYCQETRDESAAIIEEVVYSALSQSGYSDIYFTTKAGASAITSNQYDDLAPHYDSVSETIVWHRNINDVFQIMSYDVQSDTETQITDARTNNMQPVQAGEVLVWQAWHNGTWQVMLKDGDEDAVQLTNDDRNHIAPYVSGGYVIWNVTTPNQPREVAVYELATKNLSYIEDADGGQVTNPRFVLMYDTKFDNGDTVTKGYDPETGQLVPLGAAPAPTIPDIPSSDPVGETRALLNTKSSTEEEDDGVQISTKSNQDTKHATSTTATMETASESDYELTVPASSTPTTTDTHTSATTTDELSEYDLPIAPYGTTTESLSVTNTDTATADIASSTQASDS